VAADPRAELEERRHVEVMRRVRLPQRALELVHELGHDLEEVLVDEVQAPRQLLLDGGFCEPQLAREPQQLDLGPQVLEQRAALAREHALDLRLMRPDDVAKAVVQEARRTPQILGRLDQGKRLVAHTTRSRGGAPAKNALRLSSARRPIATRVSCVALPRWGSSTTFSIVRRAGV